MFDYKKVQEEYQKFGVDVNEAIRVLKQIPISLQCWQFDDIHGFIGRNALSGGIQVTGNYFGVSRTVEELFNDFSFVLTLTPGTKRINIHAIYAILQKEKDIDTIDINDFLPWVDFAEKNHVKIDFNPTCFSHPMVLDGLTLSSPNEEVRNFWINHVRASRKIAAEIGKRQQSPCLCNLWIPDGLKNNPGNRLSLRNNLKDSLQKIYEDKYSTECLQDSLESKVFGIGLESFTVGSNEFYLGFAAKNNLIPLIDSGHFHPTENIADKISGLLANFDRIALHITRSVRWDSDHVILFDDVTKEIAEELIRSDGVNRVNIGLDFFDASINRTVAMIIGQRSVQKALLYALLQPHKQLELLQNEGRFTELLMLNERIKTLPFSLVWQQYLLTEGLTDDIDEAIFNYENEVLKRRTI